VPGAAFAITAELPFHEGFEPQGGGTWWNFTLEWIACDSPQNRTTCPEDPSLAPCDWAHMNEYSTCWGPYKFETWEDDGHGGNGQLVYAGSFSGRQPIWDPYWSAMLHPSQPPAYPSDLHLSLWQHDYAGILCDCDPWGPPSRPNFDVHGWIVLTNPLRTEYYVLAVNTKKSWTHLVWATKTDGWRVSSIPRVQGWRHMEIVIHPYTGGPRDVEFLVNVQVIAQGRRLRGDGHGIDVEWLRLGGDPALITESHLTNTFEKFYYDEVDLYAEPPTRLCGNMSLMFDTDGDGDVDQSDFAAFQACYTGPGYPDADFDALNCRCMDSDWDDDVDTDDMQAFEACWSGPGLTADGACDNGLPFP